MQSARSTYEILASKRRGEELPAHDIEHLIGQFVRGDVADYQMSAFLMATAIRGMTARETVALTRAMLESGEQWNLRERFDFVADKHSSGGVGDKVSLALAPWVAACGVKVAMLSGRGLGHTGGTLDKLESIRGFNARLSREELEECVDRTGCAIATSTSGIAPADRRMYALRDVTATVDSLPLITASIMSKKLALGASALVLDVKFGSGAFMQSIDDARALAKSLIAAAAGSGTVVEALLTSMDRPLGVAVGNANEVIEAIDVLRGTAPGDVYEVTRAQAVRILVMSGRFDEQTAAAALDEAIATGAALAKARAWIVAQGGDPSFIDDPRQLPQPRSIVEIRAPRSGYITSIDARELGMLAVSLGAGRARAEDEIDYAAGFLIDRNAGDAVRAGDVIARAAFGERTLERDTIESRYLSFITFGDEPPRPEALVRELIDAPDTPLQPRTP